MLKITTSNGDTLIHADQKSDAMKFTATDGSQVVVHAGAWGRHKYIRKEGNRYIYPDDLQKANATQRHHAEVLADRRQIKKDRAHVKEDKEITNVMRKELRNYGMNLSKEDANQLRRNINTNSQIQSAHQRTVSTVPGTYDQERRATDPEAAKAQIAERRKRKEAENRPLRTADQLASAHQTSIKKTDNADGSKDMWRRVTDADTAKAQIKERKEAKDKLKSGVDNMRKNAEDRERKAKVKKQVNNAHPIASDLTNKRSIENYPAEGIELQKKKTAQRKKAKEILDKGFESSAAEEERKKAGARPAKKRPKSRTRNVINGSVKIKKGASVKTNGPVGRR